MANQDPNTDPAGAGQQTDPKPNGDGGAKGEPDLKAQNARLTQERDDWKKRAEEAEGQLKDLNDSLAKALTEDDVKAAVEEAQGEAKKAADAAESAWKQREKSLVVENALIAAGCSDTVGAKVKESYPHLFDAETVVSSAATPGGPVKKMTKDEIMAIKDPAERRAKIAEHMDLFE